MKTTGEFHKLNLIPVKKAVVDPHKGIIMRTYYVNPHKYLETSLRTKLEKSYVYITRLNDNIDKAIKSHNIHLLKNEFSNNNDWNIVINRRTDYNNLKHSVPKNDLQLYFTNLLNFTSTLDTRYLTKSKRLYKSANRNNYIFNEKIKIKKQKKIKVKVKEQQINNNIINLIETINNLDNALIEHTFDLKTEYNPIKTGLYISKILNVLNPSTPKLIKILLTISEKNLADKYHVCKNIYILPYHLLAEPNFFKSFLTTMIYNTETLEDETKFKYISLKSLYYKYFLLLLLDKKLFNDIVKEFNRNELILFIDSDFKNKLIDYNFTFFIKLIFYPKLETLITEIVDNIETYNDYYKYTILSCLSARYDITPDLFKKLFSLFNFEINIEKSINNFDRYLRGINTLYTDIDNNIYNILYIEDLIFQTIIGKMSNIVFLPFSYYDNILPLDNPFSLTPLIKTTTLQNDYIPKIKQYLSNLPTIKKETELYIPLIDINSQLNNIAYQLLPLQIGYKNINNISYSNEKTIDFIKVKVNEYKLFNDNICLFLPYNLKIKDDNKNIENLLNK